MAELGRILIADDEETFLHSTARLLHREGYQCACASDGTAVAEMLGAADYDLLIADIRMPGNEELELIRDLPDLAKGMPVILVTGYPSLHSAIHSIQLPVVAYMLKPMDFKELLAEVRSAIEHSRTYRAVCNTRQRLQDWRQDLERIERWTNLTPGEDSYPTVDAFVTLTVRNIVGCLADLKRLTQALALHGTEEDVCQLLNCPRSTALTDALVETIDILEKTKGAFKSKALAELRRKLEGLVKKEAK